jgi:hypothetical protein
MKTSPVAAAGGASEADEVVAGVLDVVTALLDAGVCVIAVLIDVDALVCPIGLLCEEAEPVDCEDDPLALLGVE